MGRLAGGRAARHEVKTPKAPHAGSAAKEDFPAATRLFARRGYDRASMSGIAAGAGITKPVLYDHFASKEALFETLLRSIRDDLLAKGRAIGHSRQR